MLRTLTAERAVRKSSTISSQPPLLIVMRLRYSIFSLACALRSFFNVLYALVRMASSESTVTPAMDSADGCILTTPGISPAFHLQVLYPTKEKRSESSAPAEMVKSPSRLVTHPLPDA